MSHKTTRREFLQSTAALGTAFWVAPSPAWSDSKSPLERLNFACIGVGGKGSSDTESARAHGNVVGLCDIDDDRLEDKAGRPEYSGARKFNDYRKMLEELEDDIDAVTISTPDHSHAPAGVMAMRMGKHCFCQKPLTWSVHEARVMRQVAAEMDVATQMGNQGTAMNGLRENVEILRDGAIGTAREVHVWTDRPIWPRPPKTPANPDHVHWDLFVGPAAYQPYNSACHPFNWRGWIDFGTGALGDMACHSANMAVMALDLFDPFAIEAESPGIVNEETFPDHATIRYEFGQRDERPPVTMIWYDGGKKPSRELFPGLSKEVELPKGGTLIIGDRGALFSPDDYGASHVLLPEEDFADYALPEPSLPRAKGHFTEFANACKAGPAAMSNFDYAARLTETVLLGNVALRVGERIEWDAEAMAITNAPAANSFVSREYRTGWRL